ncbi:S41 family peptidase [Xanthomonas cerealis pv. cerealis]|uniref:S41 family peptidase n=1 Tax=Xanthomonas cerealis pv. cerealis TaxID=152263 RepID=A0A514EI38_9XANT|nr:S41 family peptidase [Xanthomonas translucens]QDI05483.1 S41 family peptidase [Xanthomonas translucens pv. cerealis]UKE69867.1 S41 family peptidase [Xanthomonas translucens pv. pistacia]
MRVVLSAALLLALAPLPSMAQSVGEQTPPAPAASADDPDATESATSRVPLDEIRRYVAVYNAVKEAYVDPVDDKKLMQSAIRGLLLDLDPHSTYFSKEDAEAFDEQATGAYDGIGVELLQLPDNTLKVVSPIDDTPAARAGVRSGDIIVAIDGKPISAVKAMEPLRGESGSKVVLTIVREKMDKPFDVTLTRQTIRVASVRSRMLEPGYGYIRISTFQADTGADFHKQLQQLQAQSGGKLRGLVLDLRSNPGGLLTAAVQVADDLLDKGTIVTTRGRISVSDSKFDATPGDLLNGAPMVALVDAGSASASEVLAGALRDNKRARVVGSRTFGKGSVQTVLPLDNGDSVKLTTARYYTPSGKSIQASGIVPEVLLRPEESKKEDADKPAVLADYSEATLPGHLHGDDEGAEGYSAGDVLPGDAPIAQALAELKQPGAVARAAAAKQAIPKAKPAAAPASARKPAAPAASAPQQQPPAESESGKTTQPGKSEPALPPSGS